MEGQGSFVDAEVEGGKGCLADIECARLSMNVFNLDRRPHTHTHSHLHTL